MMQRMKKRPSKRMIEVRAEALENRCLLSYTLHTLADLSSTQLSDPSGVLVADANGDLFFTATQGSSANSVEALCELAKGSATPTVLTTFSGFGLDPRGLAIDPAGDLFGTIAGGGAHNDGTVWELPAGSNTVTTLASFDNTTTGSDPAGGYNLVLDTSGDLFGTAQLGGSDNGGTVWELPHGSGTITALASFQKAVTNNNLSGLVIDSAGNLFGTISRDISISGAHGAVWELPKGASTINVLVSFNGINGDNPESPLYIDSNDNIFGETNAGGTGVSGPVGDGTIFEIAAGTNTLTTLANFTGGAEGRQPRLGVAADSAGDLFGSTSGGGVGTADRNNQGVIYELPKGSATIMPIENFNSIIASSPATNILVDANANVFGTTPSFGGTVFELTPGGGGGGGGGSSSLTLSSSGKLPTKAVVPGRRATLSQKVLLTDSGSTTVSGTATATLFLSTGTTVDSTAIQLASVRKKIKLKAHKHISFAVKSSKLPATVAPGTYHLLIQVTDPSGNVLETASVGTITVS